VEQDRLGRAHVHHVDQPRRRAGAADLLGHDREGDVVQAQPAELLGQQHAVPPGLGQGLQVFPRVGSGSVHLLGIRFDGGLHQLPDALPDRLVVVVSHGGTHPPEAGTGYRQLGGAAAPEIVRVSSTLPNQ
jgi:hypothetical protein